MAFREHPQQLFCDICTTKTDSACPRCGVPLCQEHLPVGENICLQCEAILSRNSNRVAKRCMLATALLAVLGIGTLHLGIWIYYSVILNIEYVVEPAAALLLYLSVVAVAVLLSFLVGGIHMWRFRKRFLTPGKSSGPRQRNGEPPPAARP